MAWICSACTEAPAGPSQHDEGTTTDIGTTGGTGTVTTATTTEADAGSSTDDTAPPPDPACGNGITEPPEECDLGELNGTGKYCKADCRANTCGDGYLGPGETCDDGNLSNADACTSACGPPTCGDGIVQGREQCDDGQANAPNGACRPGCIAAVCGDGIVQQGVEACDGDLAGLGCVALGYDGGTLVCSRDCTYDVSGCRECSNAVLEPGEQCDGADLAGATCESLLGAGFGGPLECNPITCEYETDFCCRLEGTPCESPLDCCSGWCSGKLCAPEPEPIPR